MSYLEWLETVKANRAAWCVALESGNYKQGYGYLCSKDKEDHNNSTLRYCCLGVASKLNNIREIQWIEKCNCKVMSFADFGEFYINNKFLWEKYGIKTDDAERLPRMNDGSLDERNYSFSEIASFIRGLALPGEAEYRNHV